MTDAAAAWFGATDAAALIGVDARKLLPHQSPGYVAMEACLANRLAVTAAFSSDFRVGRRVKALFEPEGDGLRASFWEVGEPPPRPRLKSATRPVRQPTRAPRVAPAPDGDFEFTLDPDWRILAITDSAAAWCGSSPADLIGRSGRDVNPAATKLLGEPVTVAFDEGRTTVVERPSSHVPGRQVRIEVAPQGRNVRVRFEDITEQPHAEDLVALGSVLGPAEIALLDRQGVIIAANAAWRASVVAHGIEIADAGVGARYADVGRAAVRKMDAEDFTRRLEELLSGRLQQFEATFTIESILGNERRQVRITPLRIGGATYFTAIHEDLSERAKILATLSETSDQLLHAQEAERHRIAIELHDSMSQHLAGLVMGLEQLRRRVAQDQRAQAVIADMAKLTQQAIRETRVMSYLMNASTDQREGLGTSIGRLVEGFGRRTGLIASFHVRGPVEAVDAAARHAIFRVTQEALSNVHRHAGARRVAIDLTADADELLLRIADDGGGIRPHAGGEAVDPPMGVGIAGMRARMEQLGGSLQIAGDDRGAVVSATVPLRHRPAFAAE
jgi:signal transduction histidine kinase